MPATTRAPGLGPANRPVAVPEDVDDPDLPKATGVVTLPFHVRWSEPSLAYDLGQRAARLRVYEQVLREGTDDDVRTYVDVDQLLDLFDDLVLPPNVRRPGRRFGERRGPIRRSSGESFCVAGPVRFANGDGMLGAA